MSIATGRGNRLPAEIVVNVTPNRPPKIAIERPARDVEVSPLEELQLKATVSDDFGVFKTGVSYALGGDEPQEVVLTIRKLRRLNRSCSRCGHAKPPAAERDRSVDHLLDFEALKAEPDQLVSYFFWAEDIGPDGKPRRTRATCTLPKCGRSRKSSARASSHRKTNSSNNNSSSRAGRQSAGSRRARRAAKGNYQRHVEAGPPRDRQASRRPSFPPTASLLEESQQSAIEQLSELAERLEDPESLAHVEQARSHMERR